MIEWPILVNTSFNIRNKPIICSLTNVFKCFMGTELDVIAVGSYLLIKSEQDESLQDIYKQDYELN